MTRWDQHHVIHRVKLCLHAIIWPAGLYLGGGGGGGGGGEGWGGKYKVRLFTIHKRVCLYRYAYDVPFVTMILNIYIYC